jgi:type IX secretion system PorP/SprF family membrane protein
MYCSQFSCRVVFSTLLPIALVLAVGSTVVGQDLHFSQFYLQPLHLSPAATGLFQGTLRVAGLHRSQWEKVPVAYETSSGSVEWKAVAHEHNVLSVGLVLQHDRAGDGGLAWAQAGATAGVAHALNKNHSVSLGFGAAFVQRSFNSSKLTFKNQWGGDAFDPSLATGETFNHSSGFVPSLSTGGQWHYQSAKTRSCLDVGVGVSHLNKPVVNFGAATVVLPLRTSVYSTSYWQVKESTDLVCFAVWQRMARAREVVFGAGIRQILTTEVANKSNIQFSCAYRGGDAIIPALQFERNNWKIGLSYDWNISPFETASRGRGGIEIATTWTKVPVPPVHARACPLF